LSLNACFQGTVRDLLNAVTILDLQAARTMTSSKLTWQSVKWPDGSTYGLPHLAVFDFIAFSADKHAIAAADTRGWSRTSCLMCEACSSTAGETGEGSSVE
jgi:hypothetical protein